MCLFQENCKYSIKKILTYAFSLLAFYVVIFTDREVYEILLFIAALLGIRGYERVKLSTDVEDSPSPPADPVTPAPEGGMSDNTVLGVRRSGRRKKQRLLTD